MKPAVKRRTAARSAVTGKFVAKRYAKAHPRTTVNERIQPARRKRTRAKRKRS